jgi:hypothetical protein
MFGFEHKDGGKSLEKRHCSLNTGWSTRMWNFLRSVVGDWMTICKKETTRVEEEFKLSCFLRGVNSSKGHP